MILLDVMREIAIYLGIVIGIPAMLFGAIRTWQVFKPVKRFRRLKRRR